MSGNVLVLEHLLARDSSFATSYFGEYGPDGVDAGAMIHVAAERGLVEHVRVLLRHGADHSALVRDTEMNSGQDTSDSTKTPLILAAARGHRDVASVLIEAGAPIDDVDFMGYSALMRAACRGEAPMCVFLLRHGASLELTSRNGDDAEAFARRFFNTWWRVSAEMTARFLADVKAAGGFEAFVREPRRRLMLLRSLSERGRASAPPGVCARLFGLPKELVWRVTEYWPSGRDYDALLRSTEEKLAQARLREKENCERRSRIPLPGHL